MTIAEEFAAFAAGLKEIDGSVSEFATDAVQDAITAAIAGVGTKAATAAFAAARQSWGRGDAPVWFSGERLTVPGAAFVNSAVVTAMDFDDGHRAAVGHPGAGIIPAVFATIAGYAIDPQKILSAIAVGYEISIRIAAARDHATQETMVTGPWIGQGVAIAAAYLRGLPPRQIAQAIALAGASAPNLLAVGYTKVLGNHLKEGIPWATVTGLTAVDLAEKGFTGPIDLLDNESIYRPSVLRDDLGTSWAIESTYLKPYSCCRWAHAAMDAALKLQAEHTLSSDDIEKIDIETFGWASRLSNETRPETLEAAQYSVPFCVALALTQGTAAFLPMQEAALTSQKAFDLAERVEIHVAPELDAQFPSGVPARVKITTHGEVVECEELTPLGEPSNPMSRAQMDSKFKAVTRNILDAGSEAEMAVAITALRAGDFQACQTILARRAGLKGYPAALA